MKPKKLMSTLAAVSCLLVMLTGCSSGTSSSQNQSSSTGNTTATTDSNQTAEKINMLYWPGPESEAMSKVIAAYNSSQGKKDGVEVTMLPAPREGFWEKQSAMMAADSADVDIYFTASYKIGEHKNDLITLDDKLGNDLSFFIKTSLDSLASENKVYGVPMDVGMHFLYYRKDLIDTLLNNPEWQSKYKEISKQVVGKELVPKKPEEWNWDDFTAASAFFTKKVNPESPTDYGTALQAKNLIYNVMIWNDVLYSFGGSWYTNDGKPNFDTQETRKALDVYATLYQKGLTPPSATTFEYPETNQAFQTEKAALILQWSAAYHELSDQTKSPKVFDKVGIAPIPGEKHATHVHSLAVGVNKHSTKQEASLKWLKYLATKEAMTTYAENGGVPPAQEILNGLKDKRPEFPYIAEHVDKYGFVEDTSEHVFPILEILAKHFSAVWAGQTDSDSAAVKAQQDVAERLAK